MPNRLSFPVFRLGRVGGEKGVLVAVIEDLNMRVFSGRRGRSAKLVQLILTSSMFFPNCPPGDRGILPVAKTRFLKQLPSYEDAGG